MKNAIMEWPVERLVEAYNRFIPEGEKPLSLKKAKTMAHRDLVRLVSKVSPTTRKQRGITIRDRALQLLCEVDYWEDPALKGGPKNRVKEDYPKARAVGYSYAEVLRRLSDEFPTCQTSIAALRWYVSKINEGLEGYTDYSIRNLRRPRSLKKTEEAEE